MVTVVGQIKKKDIEWVTTDQIDPIDVEWLWYPYIPIGKLTMVFGKGGIGKSQLTVDLASRVSTGEPFPGEEKERLPAKVLMLNAEDDADDTLVPRLINMGANRKNVIIPKQLFSINGYEIKQLKAIINKEGVKMLVIDPLSFYMGSDRDINRANEMGGWITALFDLARETETAVILVHHVRKGQEGSTSDQHLGSAAIRNGIRSSLLVTTTNSGSPVMYHEKHNNSPEGPAWMFSIEDGKFVWGQSLDPVGLIGTGGVSGQKSWGVKVEQARDFLKVVLGNGRVEANEVKIMAKDEGISESTLNRAKIDLVKSVFKHSERKWYWELMEKIDVQAT